MFPYYGDIDEMQRVIGRNRKALKRAYADVLGSRLFRIVREADELFLNEGSFRDLDFAAAGRQKVERPSSKFLMAALTEEPKPTIFHPDGRFETDPVFMGPGFVFAQEGLSGHGEAYGEWMPPALGTYVHEYDHFVFWAIQSVPLYLAICLMADILKPERIPPAENDIEKMVAGFTGTQEEKVARAVLAAHLSFLHWSYELHTEWLDVCIYRHLGYEPPPEYYVFPPGKTKMLTYPVPTINALLPVVVKNSLPSMEGRECLLRLEKWHQFMSTSHLIQRRFMESLSGVRVRRITLDEALAMQRGRDTTVI